jgi:hypothetical protein
MNINDPSKEPECFDCACEGDPGHPREPTEHLYVRSKSSLLHDPCSCKPGDGDNAVYMSLDSTIQQRLRLFIGD